MNYSKVKMVNSDTDASKLMKKGWALINAFSHGNVIAYILTKEQKIEQESEKESIEDIDDENCEKSL